MLSDNGFMMFLFQETRAKLDIINPSIIGSEIKICN